MLPGLLWAFSRTAAVRDMGAFGPGEVRSLIDAMAAAGPQRTVAIQSSGPENRRAPSAPADDPRRQRRKRRIGRATQRAFADIGPRGRINVSLRPCSTACASQPTVRPSANSR